MKRKSTPLLILLLSLASWVQAQTVTTTTTTTKISMTSTDEFIYSDESRPFDSLLLDDNLHTPEFIYHFENGGKVDSLRSGQWEIFYPSGEKKGQITYERGEAVGKYKVYYKDGTIEEEGTFLRNHNVGEFKRYYPNGNLEQKFIFSPAGRRSGPQYYYHSNGKLYIEVTINQGAKDGFMIRYNEDGDVAEEKFYYDGTLVAASKNGQAQGIEAPPSPDSKD